jgi:hypothetical protein
MWNINRVLTLFIRQSLRQCPIAPVFQAGQESDNLLDTFLYRIIKRSFQRNDRFTHPTKNRASASRDLDRFVDPVIYDIQAGDSYLSPKPGNWNDLFFLVHIDVFRVDHFIFLVAVFRAFAGFSCISARVALLLRLCGGFLIHDLRKTV